MEFRDFSVLFIACVDTDGVLISNIHGVDQRSDGALFQLFGPGIWLQIERLGLRDPRTLPSNDNGEPFPHYVTT
jgi:hypothetical protein